MLTRKINNGKSRWAVNQHPKFTTYQHPKAFSNNIKAIVFYILGLSENVQKFEIISDANKYEFIDGQETTK
jgi:hypothetical protein